MTRSRTVLVVDDDIGIQRALSRMLGRLGHEAVVTGSVESALPLMARRCFDVLLLDVNLPGASGLDLLRALKTRGIEVPVILISGFASVDDVVRALRDDAEDFLQKPFTLSQLDDAIGRATESPGHVTDDPLEGSNGNRPAVRGETPGEAVWRISRRLLADVSSIPDMSNVATELARIASEPDLRTDRLVAVLSRAPSVAARVLKVANTAFYRGHSRVTNLNDALVRLGARALTDIAVTTELRTMYEQTHPIAGPWLRDLWRHQVMAACVAHALAVGEVSPHDAYLSALFRDVGHAVIVRELARGSVNLVDQGADDLRDAITQAHRRIGARLLGQLSFPPLTVAVCASGTVHGAAAPGLTARHDQASSQIACLCDAAAVLAEDAGHLHPLSPVPPELREHTLERARLTASHARSAIEGAQARFRAAMGS